MDMIQTLMNIVIPPVSLIILIFILPIYLAHKFVTWVLRFLYEENVRGKVVLITGASSGIGQHLAYEYARRGACLALCARRENLLCDVANMARHLGSPDVIAIRADVSKVEDCKQLVDKAVHHFGRLDHLVNNAGIVLVKMFEELKDPSDSISIIDTNFWGYVFPTYFAIPHLKKSKGKIAVNASITGWLSLPYIGSYCASKAALFGFYETLRIEVGKDIGITILSPGLIDTGITSEERITTFQAHFIPRQSSERSARTIVNSICRGDRYLTEPSWYKVTYAAKVLCPEVVEWITRTLFVTRPKALLQKARSKTCQYPTLPQLKSE
ncbi:Short-chain dehydrogenase/reductase SDR [Dillenia turbinata]|uniref:Short-chain dehydrogenase/reductase SDR n=1 Tax=Dillenia turbinata TaxID=194707 RepID=A0AAN8V6W9_9MAGN